MPIIEGTTSDPILYAGTPSNGTNEVQLITYTATTGTAVADAGTFKISFEGYTTSALAYDASAATVQAALRALPSIGALGCSVVLTAGPPRLYEITFDAGNMAKRNVAAVTTTSSLLQGANVVNAVVTTTTPGVDATGFGALPGKMLLDTTNGLMYFNSGTALAPVWTAISSNVQTATAMASNGAVAFGAYSKTVFVTKAGVCAMTLADPTATTHDGCRLTFISTTAQAHTLSNAAGSGFNAGGGASDIGTFGGAIGDGCIVEAYQGKWYVVNAINVTFA